MPAVAFKHHERVHEPAQFHAGGATRSVRQDALHAAGGQIYTPPGWPDRVLPPGAPDWERSATAFLLDCCPADYRAHAVLLRHPVVLARFAADFVEGQIRTSRGSLTAARPSLADYVDAGVLDQCVEALQAEEARLVRTRRAVALIEEALRGRVFLRKL